VTCGPHGLGLGLDCNNRVTILVPGGQAEADGVFRVGDVVTAVNGERLDCRLLAEVLPAGLSQYRFSVCRAYTAQTLLSSAVLGAPISPRANLDNVASSSKLVLASTRPPPSADTMRTGHRTVSVTKARYLSPSKRPPTLPRPSLEHVEHQKEHERRLSAAGAAARPTGELARAQARASLADAEMRLKRLARTPSWERLGVGDAAGDPTEDEDDLSAFAVAFEAALVGGQGERGFASAVIGSVTSATSIATAGERLRKQLKDAEFVRKQLEAKVAALQSLALHQRT